MAGYQTNDNSVQQVKDAADIVECISEWVPLKKSGSNYKGCCPFHSEKTPSFMVNPSHQFFHCFGCGESGDIFSFIMKYHRLSFPEALKKLANRYSIILPEKKISPREMAKIENLNRLYEITEKTAEIYHQNLINNFSENRAGQYLQQRGISKDIVKSFYLGYAPPEWNFLEQKIARKDGIRELLIEAGLIVKKERSVYDRFRDRILCPIYDLTGRVIGFGGRILGDGQPKYLNSPETPIFDKGKNLFGLYQNRDVIRKSGKCLIVEGNFDLLSLVTNGIRNVVAPLGTALTSNHLKLVKRHADQAFLFFDGDSAGRKAAIRSTANFLNEELDGKVLSLPDGHDPDTYVREFGTDGVNNCIKQAKTLSEFVFEGLVKEHGLSLEGKGRITRKLRELVDKVNNKNLQQTLFISHFSKKLGILPEQLINLDKGSVKPLPNPIQTERLQKAVGKINIPFKHRQLIEFLIHYPEYIQSFFEAGIKEEITHPVGLNIINSFLKLAEKEPGFQPERLFDELEGKAERQFISRLLLTASAHEHGSQKEMATEMLAWLKNTHSIRKRKELGRQIEEAQQLDNIPLLMELLRQKKEFDLQFGS
jgi:DNA primase